MLLRSSLRRQGVAGEKTVRYQDPEGDRKKKKIGYGILITVNSQKPFISPTERNRPLLDNGLHYRLGFIPNFPCFISAFYHI